MFRPSYSKKMAVRKLLFFFSVLLVVIVVLETTEAHCGESSTHGELPFPHSLISFHGADANLAAGGIKIGVDDVLKAWYMDDIAEEDDRSLPHHHRPDEAVPLAKLPDLGIVALRLDAENHERDENLTTMRQDRGYLHMDIIELTPEKMPNYEAMTKRFFEEHLHADEEVRYCLQGSGYFDVRDEDDRCPVGQTVNKQGRAHRRTGWTLPSFHVGQQQLYQGSEELMIYRLGLVSCVGAFQAMRLFSGGPDWTAYNRPHDHLPARKKYLDALHSGRGTQQDRDN